MVRLRVGGDVLVALPIVFLLVAVARVSAPPLANSLEPGAAADKLANAASAMETALGANGSGFRFEIVQAHTLRAKAGGPRVSTPDGKLVDEHRLYARVARGIVTSQGFWAELRDGPAAGAEPRYSEGRVRFGALVAEDGRRYRNDGRGWYRAEVLPGFGLDPRTATLLPALLRNATSAVPGGVGTDANRQIETILATGKVADIPGVISVDGTAFTELTGPITFGLDTAGRLATAHINARNTNEKRHHLLVDTVIRILYDDIGPIPPPLPAASPVATRTPQS